MPADKRGFDLSKVLPWSLEWLALFCVPADEVDVLIFAMSRMPRLKRLWVQIHCFSATGEHVVGKDEAIACTERVQHKMQENCIEWCGPHESSPFEPYIRYLDVHGGQERCGWLIGEQEVR